MSRKLTHLLILIIGAVMGSFIASLTRGIPFLSWLSFGGTFGIATSSPMVVDIGVLQLTFGLTFHITVAVILGLIIAGLICRKL